MTSTHLSLRTQTYLKRLVALGLFVTLCFFTIFAIGLWDMGRRDRQKALDAATNLVGSISSDISHHIELHDLSLKAVVKGLRLQDIDKINPELRRFVLFDRGMYSGELNAILVINPLGNVTIDSRVMDPEAVNYSTRDFFQVHQQRADVGLYISRPWLAHNGEYLVNLSRRISNTDGSFAGVVAGTMRLSYFHDLFKGLKFGTDDAVALMRTDGTVMMRAPFKISSIGENLSKSEIFKQFPKSRAGSYETASLIDGVKRLFVFQQVGEYPLLVVNGLSINTIYGNWRQNAWLIGSIIFALCSLNMALVVYLGRELKRRGAAEQKLAVMATRDSLTGLCNRRGLDEVIEREWHRSKRNRTPISLLMIDVDFFKAYNDKYGHQAGDQALAAIARCIETATGRASDLSARYGGEEFVVLLPAQTMEGAAQVAERIRANVLSLHAEPENQLEIAVTVSVGVASMIPNAGLSLRDLVGTADAALYQAKRKGRNRVEVAPTIRMIDFRREEIAV